MHIWFTPCELNYPQPCLFVDNIVVLYCNLENLHSSKGITIGSYDVGGIIKLHVNTVDKVIK